MWMAVSNPPQTEDGVGWLIVLAFGIFARVLPGSEDFLTLRAQTAGLELADSVTVDGHKILNVVCGLSPCCAICF